MEYLGKNPLATASVIKTAASDKKRVKKILKSLKISTTKPLQGIEKRTQNP